MNQELDKMKKLNEQTKIEVGFKHVISLVTGMLAIMYGFYQFVVIPKFESHETQMNKIETTITEGFDNMNTNFQEIYMGIGTLNGNVEGINKRFNDLNRIRNSEGDQGGGFGSN